MFSVLTPTFNRAHTLHRVFESLKAQTFQEFEWIIIDDASTDNTKDLIENWKKLNLTFSINYIVLPENKGKPNALNVGFDYCTQEITVIADSDDAFISNTFKDLNRLWNSVNITEKAAKIATIWTLVKDENQNLVGEVFPYNFWQVDFENRLLKKNQGVVGEKWHSWRTDVLKKYRMFHNDNSFISEGATWNRINKDYDFLCVNIFHRTYYSSPDGYIQKQKSRLELEKIKYYNAYYQLYQTSILDLFKYGYYHNFAFDYTKSNFIYNDKNLKLSSTKKISCLLIAILFLPKRLFAYFSLKALNND